MPKKNGAEADPTLMELQSIKRLLVFGLLRSGASQDEVATALGITQGTVSRMFPRALRSATGRTARKAKAARD